MHFRILPGGIEDIVPVRIDPDNERQVVEFDHPDRLGHAEILKIDTFQGHVR